MRTCAQPGCTVCLDGRHSTMKWCEEHAYAQRLERSRKSKKAWSDEQREHRRRSIGQLNRSAGKKDVSCGGAPRAPQKKCKVCGGMPWARHPDRRDEGCGGEKPVVGPDGRCLGCGGRYSPETSADRRDGLRSSAGTMLDYHRVYG